MRVKVVPIFTAILLAFGLVAMAQETQPPAPAAPQTQGPGARQGRRHGAWQGDPVSRRLQHMSERLNLTDDQKAKIRPILQSEFQQARAIRDDATMTPDQKKAKFQDLRKSTQPQIDAILTPEQRAIKAQGRSQGMDVQRRVDMLSHRLNLTDDQKAKLTPLLQNQMQQVKAVKEDTSLSQQQKRAKVQQIRKDTHQQMLALLTPEQQQQLRSMHGGKYGGHGQGKGAPQNQPPAPGQGPGR